MKPARVVERPVQQESNYCANCQGISLLVSGLCLNCLLDGALEDSDSSSKSERWDETVALLKIGDSKWRLGNYEILDEIGRGGMAVIYRAREIHSQHVVALKRVSVGRLDSPQALARFRREAETAARLVHPNIVPVYYIGESDDGSPFFTMKLAPHGNLAQARPTLSAQPRRCVFLMTKVALAVQYAHDQGVFHRDLKPHNILLDEGWHPLVSDFGLAKWQNDSSQLTRTLTSFGTPNYVAPEQVTGSAACLTPAADVYSLGAILFELLTGRPPFLGEHPLAVIRQAAEKSAPKLRRLASKFDRDLETICARCLEREPSARYQSAKEFAQDLNNWLEGRSIATRPVAAWLRVLSWFRANRNLAVLLAAFFVLGVASLGRQIHERKDESAIRESLLASRSAVVLPFFDLDKVAPDPSLAQSFARSLQDQLNVFGPARIKTAASGPSLGLGRAEDVRKAGQQAKTRTVFTGTVRTVQGKKRISIQLRDAATAEPLFTHIWQENGSSEPTEAVNHDIARTLYAILSAKDWSNLGASKFDPGLRSDAAKETIIAGRELISQHTMADFDRAIALFKKAIQIEPRSSLAHSYLAIAATTRTHYISDSSFLDLGEEESLKAVELSPDSSDAHRALAGVHYQRGQFADALEEQLRIIELGGLEEKTLSFIGLTLDTLGRSNQALTWYKLARKLERSAGEVDAIIGDCWAQLCYDEQALQAYHRAAELQPNSPSGTVGICHLRLLEGDLDGARQLYKRAGWKRGDPSETEQIAAQTEFFARNFDVAEKFYSDLSIADADGGGSFYGAITYRSALGRMKQALGDGIGGKALLERSRADGQIEFEQQPENPAAAYRLAAVEASLSMVRPALQHLHAAASLGWIDYRSLDMDPRFDAVRLAPEFHAVIKDLASKVTQMRLNQDKFVGIAKY